MSIFDITPVGAYMSAIQLANANDKQNTQTVQNDSVPAGQNTGEPSFKVVAKALIWTLNAIKQLPAAVSLRSKSA